MVRLCEIFKDPAAYAGPIQVAGWVRTVRDSKAVGFIELADGSSFKNVQVVYEQDAIDPQVKKQLCTGCAISVAGTLELTPEAKQPFEIKAQAIAIEGACQSDYPLQRSGIPWNICAPSSISGPGPIFSRPPSGCAPW